MGPRQQLKLDSRESVEKGVITSLQSIMEKLEAFWREFGLSENQITERYKTVLGHVKTLLDELVEEEEESFINIKKQIKSYEVQLQQLFLELDIPAIEINDKLSLLQKEEILHSQFDELNEKKQARIEKYQQMRKSESRLCDMLGNPKTSDISSAVPKEQELYELEQHIKMLSDEREHRYHKFCSVKKQLSTILEETDFTPETSFERDLICYNLDETFVLSQENLDQLKQTVEKFQQFKQDTTNEIQKLSAKLKTLWDRLNIDRKLREKFERNYSEVKRSTVVAMQVEIERCEEIKMQNIKHYINTVRDELDQLWKKCFVSDENRHQFEPYYSEEYTEVVLELHDAEVDRLKKYYEETKEIFKKISKRQELWKMMLMFERTACDPKRFTNRGGTLLLEEKRRNKLVKDHLRLENEILRCIGEYEVKNDTLFLINGITFSDFIKMEWEGHQKEKLEHQNQQSIKMDSANVLAPCKRPLLSSPAAIPFKLLCTRNGLSSPSKCSKQAVTPSLQKNTKHVRRHSPRLTPKLTKGLVRTEENVPNAKHLSSTPNNTTSYAEFKNEMDKDCREHCRSSVGSSKRKLRSGKIYHSGSTKRRRSRTSNARRSHIVSKSLFQDSKSTRNTSRTLTKLTPARGKLGLPFLI